MDTEPDLTIKGLSLWVTRRLYPNSAERWDADENLCLVVTEANGARVRLDGNIASRNFHFFGQSVEKLHEQLEGAATLDATDMGLVVRIKPTSSLGHMVISVEMSFDYNTTQSHRFSFECDQTDLPAIARQCRALLERFPMMIPLP